MQPTRNASGVHIRVQQWLRIEQNGIPGIYARVFESARITSVNYWLEIIFSAAIAVLGLVLNSPAVIIGAMLISPLMGPIMATGLALTIGDLYLAIKAVTTLIVSVAVAVSLTAAIVWLLPFHSATPEIISRTNPTLLDLGVAVVSGLAGSFVVCRGTGGEGVTALPGVAIAVALMPPLGTMGFGLGSGGDMEILGGAGLLFLTNLVAIVSSAFLVFYLVGMSSQEVGAEIRKAQAEDRFARQLSRGPLARAFSDGGRVRWRILILVVLLGSIAVPLKRALSQVAGETLARNTVQSVMKTLAPPSTVVSQEVQIGRESIVIRIVSTRNIGKAEIENTEQLLSKRTGRQVELSVQEVASRSELAELAARLNPAVAAPPPPQQPLDDFRQHILKRLTPAVTETWPPEAPLQSFNLQFDVHGIVCNVTYQADQDLDGVLLAMILKELREKLQSPDMMLNATRVPPPRPERRKTGRR